LGATAAAGGKGVVIISHSNSLKQATTLTGGSVANQNGAFVYTFNDSGTIGWS
jgi:hypothetical protein